MKNTTLLVGAFALLALTACPKPPPPELSSLTLSPETARLAMGEAVQFVASATFTDGEVRDVTAQTLWSVDDAFVGAASSETAGLIEGKGTGQTVVRARFGGRNITRAFTVVDAELRELQLDPPHPILPVGLSVALKVTAIRSDGTTQDVTAEAVWSTSSAALAEIEQSAVIGRSPGTLTISASVQGLLVTAPVDVTTARVESIDVQPSTLSLPQGHTRQLTATALLSDGSSLDVTRQAAWRSSAPQIAFASELPGEEGMVAGRAAGSARVSASLLGQSGGSELTVTSAQLLSLELGPAITALANGTRQQFTVTGAFSDGTTAELSRQVTWSSSNPSVFTAIDGQVTALAVGHGQLTASFGSVRVSRALQITGATLSALELRPTPAVVARGLTLDVAAIATFSDGTQQDLTRLVLWRVVNPSFASVSNAANTAGRVTGANEGVTELTATLAGLSAQSALTVSGAALASVQVTPTAPTLARGTTRAFTATGIFSDGTTQDLTAQATWSSSDVTHVAISSQGANRGEAQAIAQGTSSIRAAIGGKSGSTLVTVSDAVLAAIDITPASTRLPLGVSSRHVATGRFSDGSTADLTAQATWSSSAPTVASVSNLPGAQGLVQALTLGTAQLSAQLGAITGTAAVNVTTASITALELSPASATIAVGLTRGFNAVATYSDGTSQDITAQAGFTTVAPSIATVISGGPFARVTGRAAGTTSLVATAMGFTARAELTVTPAQLTGLSIDPGSMTLARGTAGRLTAEATWSDGSSADVTTQVTWSSGDATVVTISNAAGSAGTLTALTMGTALVRAQLGSLIVDSTITVSPATLSTIEVTPTTPAIPLGGAQRFIATGRYSDGSAQDLSTQVNWSSSTPAVLSISNVAGQSGQATALSQGSVLVRAAFMNVTGNTPVTVTAATLSQVQLSPAQPRLAKDTRISLSATGVWSDGASQELTGSCSWSSGTPSIATVSNAPGKHGRVTGLAAGIVTISATCSGITGNVDVTITNAQLISIELTPATPSAAAGFTFPLTATGRFSDGTTQAFSDFVTWSSADSAKATVSSLGVVSARLQGTVIISAQALGVTGTVSFSISAAVLESIELAPSPAALPKGLTQSFVAIGHFSDGTTAPVSEAATWSSSQLSIATVSNAAGNRGHATALSEGVTQISAVLSGHTASSTLTVTPASLTSIAITPNAASVAKGLTLQLTAMGTFSDGTTRDVTAQVTWSAGDGAVAVISNVDARRGQLSALAVGSTGLSATLGTISGVATITVTSAVLVSIGVTPANTSLPRGAARQLTAMGVYTDGSSSELTAQVTWTTSDATCATISNGAGSEGLVQSFNTGSAQLTATQGAISGSTSVTVTPAVLQQLVLTPPAPSVAAGLTTTLTASGTYSDASTQDLSATASWTSSDLSIATVSGGVVNALKSGSIIVTASVGAVSTQVTLTVTAAVLQQLQVTPQNVSVPKGLTQQFTAMGVFSDGTTAELTSSVTWASSDETKVIVSNAGTRGLASTPGSGAVNVSATLSGITGTTPFTVSAAVLNGMSLTPGGSTASLGSVRQYLAIGRYTDGSTQPLTTQVSWSSSDAAVATISNANGSQGLTTTLATGRTTISAVLGAFTATSNLIVIQNPLTSIELTPASGGTALGYSRQFIAIGTYSDGTTQVLTHVVTWSSTDPSVAIVSNADGSRGLFSTVGTGSVTVSATHQGVTGSVVHAVTPAVLVALSLSQGSVSLAVGQTAQLSASGFFSDGSMQDLTNTVTWNSTVTTVAQVSNASGSEGLVTGIAPGSAQVSATQGSVSESVNVTVN